MKIHKNFKTKTMKQNIYMYIYTYINKIIITKQYKHKKDKQKHTNKTTQNKHTKTNNKQQTQTTQQTTQHKTNPQTLTQTTQ